MKIMKSIPSMELKYTPNTMEITCLKREITGDSPRRKFQIALKYSGLRSIFTLRGRSSMLSSSQNPVLL